MIVIKSYILLLTLHIIAKILFHQLVYSYILILLPSAKLLRIINKNATDSVHSRATSPKERTQSKMVPISGNFPSN